jgi:mannitol-1-/sugar-/sorbitol-6-phosphatase
MTYLGLPMPEGFVTADDASKGKRHSEAYSKGAEILKARPGSCVVVEEAPSGIQAARAACMPVAALVTTYPAEDLHEADVIAPALAKVSVTCRTGSHEGPRFELYVPDCRSGQTEMIARD